MSERYEIQGRVVEWRGGVVLRDEARRDARDSLDAAKQVAAKYLADGLVTWIFLVRWEPGRTTPTYTLVSRSRPSSLAPSCRIATARATVGSRRAA
ncbi:hypothetical protein [Pseudonocardia sp.]|uniref:hypothetical protein n=1 Tax=Pseudonocardia sp. TaxID=60912 RepID=UPI002605B9F8|nr:hypothetical protein [Pseudonocardia sp.]